MRTIISMLRDQSGASAAEYALILAIVGGAIALAAVTLGGSGSVGPRPGRVIAGLPGVGAAGAAPHFLIC